MDTIKRIVDKIQRLKSQLIRGTCASQVAMETRCKDEAYDEILSFIDSLPKEHKQKVVKREMNVEEAKEYLELHGYFCTKQLKLIQRSWYLEGYDDARNGMEPMWTVKACKGGPKVEKNPRYVEPLDICASCTNVKGCVTCVDGDMKKGLLKYM